MHKLIFSFLIYACFTSCIKSQWYQQTVPQDLGVLLSVNFTDANNGSATGWQLYYLVEGKAIYTTNAGLNWVLAQLPDSVHAMVSAQFINPAVGYCAGAYNPVSKLQGRINPQVAGREYPLTTILQDNLMRLGRFQYDTTFGLFLKSTNKGQSWFTYGVLPQNVTYLDGMYFIDQNTGYVTTQKNQEYNFPGVLKTTNGGLTWTEQTVPDSLTDLTKITFTDPNTGFAIAKQYSYGAILRTTNGGANWVRFSFYDMDSFNDINFTNTTTGFAAGTMLSPFNVVIYRTTNAGVNWTLRNNLGDSVHLFGMRFIKGTGVGLAYGTSFLMEPYGSYIIRTSNYGSSWVVQNVMVPEQELLGSFMYDNNNWYLCGTEGAVFTMQGLIYHTTTGGDPIGIKPISSEIPKSFSLSQNYPNPFNPTTKINFSIPPSKWDRGMSPLSRGVDALGGRGVSVHLIIYDLLGREVATLVNEGLSSGTYQAEFDGTNYPSGVYFYRLLTDEYSETKKMVLVK